MKKRIWWQLHFSAPGMVDQHKSSLTMQLSFSIPKQSDTGFEIYTFIRHMMQNLSTTAIDWLVIPVRASHFGGLWETPVKTMIHHRRKVMKKQLLINEHFTA